MTSLDHLLPDADEAVRCAEHRRTLGLDPGGTAIRADRVVLVKTPLPWPKPVAEHPVLAPVAPILAQATVPTRTLAYVAGGPGLDDPEAGNSGADGGSLGRFDAPVITFDRGPDGAVVERRYAAGTTSDLELLAMAIAQNDTDRLDGLARYHQPLTNPVALVCVQGSHDVCCGSEGTRFAVQAEAVGGSLGGLTVYRVSHTGGHRFAPTAMTLPDGRMWADLDLPLLGQILSRSGDTADVVDRCRGWWGVPTGPAQLAERAVFAAEGWSLEHQNRTVEVGDTLDGAAVCVVSDGRRSWSVTVTVDREVPTIACRQPGGVPAKSALEYRVGRAVLLH